MREKDLVVTEKNEACGGVVYWTLSGGVSAVALAQAWAAEGLDAKNLPEQAPPEKALRIAVDSLRDRAHLVRRLPDGSGFALIAEHEVDAKAADYKTTLRAYIDVDGSIMIDPSGHPSAERVLDAYDAARADVSANDISALLIATCRQLNAVSLRTMGGIYFVPAVHMPTFERVVRAVESCSANRVWRLPAMRSEDAARAVLAAISEEAEGEAARMEEELSRDGDDAMGARAINTRGVRVAALRSKVGEYEELLGASLDAVGERLVRIQAALAAAALAAQCAKEAA